jgi:hypothetical protein
MRPACSIVQAKVGIDAATVDLTHWDEVNVTRHGKEDSEVVSFAHITALHAFWRSA